MAHLDSKNFSMLHMWIPIKNARIGLVRSYRENSTYYLPKDGRYRLDTDWEDVLIIGKGEYIFIGKPKGNSRVSYIGVQKP